MSSNGFVELTLKGVTHPLYFGRQAVEEFSRRTEKYLTDNGFKISVDMVFAGMANYSTKNDIPVVPYTKVYELLEDASDDPKAFAQQMEVVDKVFWESRYGSEYGEKLKEVKKKVEEEILQMEKELSQPTSTGQDSESSV